MRYDPPPDVTFGRSLDSSLVEKGLRELCPGIHFDLAGCIGQWHPAIEQRQGVYFEGLHIGSMDRGMIPEFKIWNQVEIVCPGEWWEADKDGASISYVTLDPSEPNYQDLRTLAGLGSDPTYSLTDTGKVQRREVYIRRKVRGRCIRLGWRNTFEKLVSAGLPGIDRTSLSKKFAVDMYLFPVGAPEEIAAVLSQEP